MATKDTRRQARNILVGAIGAAVMILSASLPAGAVPALGEVEQQVGADRVIDRTTEKVPSVFAPETPTLTSRQTSSLTVTKGDIDIPEDLQPRVGELVQVNYSDAVLILTAPKAGCTTTTTAQVPWKNGNAVRTSASHYRSTGCSQIKVVGSLLHQTLGAWNSASTFPSTGYPGQTSTMTWQKACGGTGSKNWRTAVYDGHSNQLAASGIASLSCTP